MSEGNIFQFEPIDRRRIPGRGEGARSRQERRAGPSTREYDTGSLCQPTTHDRKRQQQGGVKAEVRAMLAANFDRMIERGDGEVALTMTKAMAQRLIDEGESPQVVERARRTCVVALADLSHSKTTMPLHGRRQRFYVRQFSTRSRPKPDVE